MRFGSLLAPVLATFLLAVPALAQNKPAGKDAAAKPAEAKKDEAKPAAKVETSAKPAGPTFRTEDPDSKPGPYLDAIAKGEAAFAARDFPGAIKAFQDAIKIEPNKIMGHYRLGEAQLASGKPDEAKATWQAALNKKGTDDQKAKVLFVLADLEERAKNWQAAKDGWAAYAKLFQEKPGTKGYPATAVERQRQADRRMRDEKDYGAVKERIAKREAEKTKEAEENAKKDKLNK